MNKKYSLLFVIACAPITAMNTLAQRKNRTQTNPPENIKIQPTKKKKQFTSTRTKEEQIHNKEIYDFGYDCGWYDGCCFGTLLTTATSGLVFTTVYLLEGL